MTQEILTRETVRNLLTYDLNTGIFTWDARPSNRVKAGDVAGSPEGRGYLNISIGGKKYKSHRLAFMYVLGYIPEQVDHINHIRTDNRWINLRKSDKSDNKRNQSKRVDNTSGYVGVTWFDRDKVWFAQIQIDGKMIHLGRFKNKQDAIKARAEADIKHGFHPNHGRD